MTTTESIELLLKPISKLTEQEFVYFTANPHVFREVSLTREYFTALGEKMKRESETPGGTNTPHLQDHVTHKSGRRKTVCTSAALAFFNISPARYHYSGHEDQDNSILRRHGWSVRSRKSKFGIRQGCSSGVTLGKIRRKLAMEGDASEKGYYKVSIKTREGYHCIVLGRDGSVIVDTASGVTNNRCKARDIYLVRTK